MTLKIESEEIEKLLEEVVAMTGESKTEAVRKALEERRRRFALGTMGSGNGDRLLSFLQEEIWPQIPQELLGTQLTKAEEEEILGFDEDGI